MVGPSLNSHNLITLKPIKFLCSYGGRILPRYPDGKLRYQGGETRVLSVGPSISFSELLVKLGKLCGTTSLSLRCQLPTEDLDALVSITSDEDLANLMEEYLAAAQPSIKIRAFIFTPKTTTKVSPPSSSSSNTMSPKSWYNSSRVPPRCPSSTSGRCIHHVSSPPPAYVLFNKKAAGKIPRHQYACINGGHVYVQAASKIFLFSNDSKEEKEDAQGYKKENYYFMQQPDVMRCRNESDDLN